jgi:16S rRNA G966 N2-methylase RsmD
VFLDPPYEAGPSELDPVLAALDLKPLLREGFTVALSRGSRSSNGVIPLHWLVARRLIYGDSVVTLFRSRSLPRTPGTTPSSMEV